MAFLPDGSMRAPARLVAALALGGVLAAATMAPPAWADPAPDPVIAKVNQQDIHLSDLKSAAEMLPPQARSLPPQQLYPLLLNQLIDAQALLVQARKDGADKDPDTERLMRLASERALESAYLNKLVQPQVSEDAIKAKYQQDIANKPGEMEVHARHILVPDEATAKKIIAELQKGGDFVALSKQYSKDPGAAQQGGDLGWFKKSEMVPEFANAAFALKDNEVSATPVHSQFGWHVIQTLGHRTETPPTLEQSHDQLRQQLAQAAVQKVVDHARQGVTIEKFNLDGSPLKATDSAEPPPAPAK
jgi:peptidyl-prolyl cis-trans isomerase C